MDALVRQYERPVFNAALRMTGSRDDASDITQTTFLKAFRNLHQFETGRRFFSWIYRIALNESVNLLNRRRQGEPLGDDQASVRPGPDSRANAAERNQLLEQALTRLSDDHRRVITLKYFVGCSYAQIADVLDIEEKTVKSRLYSARCQLKDLLERAGVTRS